MDGGAWSLYECTAQYPKIAPNILRRGQAIGCPSECPNLSPQWDRIILLPQHRKIRSYPPPDLRMRLGLANANRMLLLLPLLLAGCDLTERKLDFGDPLKGNIPSTAHLLHAGAQYAGIDSSYRFVFNLEDDALLNQLIAEWNLSRNDSPAASGFFSIAKHTWCCSQESAAASLARSFGRCPESGLRWDEHDRKKHYRNNAWNLCKECSRVLQRCGDAVRDSTDYTTRR